MISPEQRELRKRRIGSSDAAAILKLDPHRSPADVWLEKTGRAAGFEGNDATEAGTLLERAVLDWAEHELGRPLTRDVFVDHPSGLLCANLDAGLSGGSEIVEAKTTGIVGPPEPKYGDITDGENVELPDRVLIQVHHQFAVCPTAVLAWVPVLIGGVGFRMYRVSRNDRLAEIVAGEGLRFMQQHVRTDVRPDDFKPSLEVLKRVRREPNKTCDLATELVDRWIVAKADEKSAKEERDAAEAELLAALGDAEAGRCAQGLLTYFEINRKAYSVAASTYRQLRLKAAKGH